MRTASKQFRDAVRVTVIDATGDRLSVIGGAVYEMPEGVELPDMSAMDDGHAHYLQFDVAGELHCLPECWCQQENPCPPS